MPTGTACKGFAGWLFLHHLQNRTNRAILTYIIMQSERRKPDVPAADRKIFQPHPQSDHHHGGAGGPAGGMAAVGVFLPHHRPRVGQRRLAAAQSVYDAVPRAQGREQRLQDRLDRAHGGAAAAGRGTVPLLWQQAPGQAAAQQAAGGGRGPQGRPCPAAGPDRRAGCFRPRHEPLSGAVRPLPGLEEHRRAVFCLRRGHVPPAAAGSGAGRAHDLCGIFHRAHRQNVGRRGSHPPAQGRAGGGRAPDLRRLWQPAGPAHRLCGAHGAGAHPVHPLQPGGAGALAGDEPPRPPQDRGHRRAHRLHRRREPGRRVYQRGAALRLLEGRRPAH